MAQEATIRDEIVSIIQGIAVSNLGFDDTSGNVKSYLSDFHEPALIADYHMANIDGEKEARAWGVQVTAGTPALFFTTTPVKTQRLYTILIRGYYDLGQDGAGVNLIIDHSTDILSAIRDGTTEINNTVDLVNEVGEVVPSVEAAPDTLPREQLVVADIVINAAREAATF